MVQWLRCLFLIRLLYNTEQSSLCYTVGPYALGLVVQSCLILCDPMESSPPGSSVHRDSTGKNTGVGCHVLLQGIFPPQGSNLGLFQIVGGFFTD